MTVCRETDRRGSCSLRSVLLKVKHFHLCNKIAERGAEAASTQLSRTVKDLEEHKMVDGHATDTPA